VVQYFAQWAVYGRSFYPRDVRIDKLTHMHYAFYEVTSDCRAASIDEYADYQLSQTAAGRTVRGNIAAFVALREEQASLGHTLRLILSLGGWTKSTHFSSCSKTHANRQALVSSAVALLDRTGFDGLDLDWEYPVCCGLDSNGVDPADWENYVLLLQMLRGALDVAHPTEHKELSIAMGMSPAVTGIAPKAALADVLDCIYLMTYDYNGDWNEFTGHLAPLYPDPAYPGDPDFHISWGVAEWTAAVPASKLAMGMPSYGRSWYGTTELFGFGATPGPGTYWEPPNGGEQLGILRYDEITSSRFAGFTRSWSDTAKVPYLHGYLNGRPAFITYDDPESIAIKARYGQAAGLAGLMFWEASEDSSSGLLLRAIEAWNEGSRRRSLLLK